MSTTLPYLRAADLHRVLDYPSLVETLREAFAAGAQVPLRHVHAIDDAVDPRDLLLLMPAWRGGDAIGVKIVTVFPGNAARGASTVGATYLLLDGATGHARAVIDGEALTLRRTAAASALASRYLSRPDARTLVLVGAGQLAPCLAHAHAAVRPIGRVIVWARRGAQAATLAERLRGDGLAAEAAADLDLAVAQADIVSCATTSTEPLVRAASVRAGTHVDLVGGFTRAMREADDALVARAGLYVDTRAGALAEAGDLVQPLEAGLIRRESVRAELAELARGDVRGRSSADEITLFKSVGTALEDLAAARLALARLGDGTAPGT